MRAFVLALAASCTMLFACVEQPPASLGTGGSGGGTGGSGNGGGGVGGTGGGSGGSGNGGPMSAAQTFFEERVSPIMEADCAMCHAAQYDANDEFSAPNFMGNTNADYYQSLISRPDFVNADPGSSYLLTKGIHTGPAFEVDDADTVRTWLQMEADAKDPGGTTVTGPSGEELIEQFVSCMDYQDWLDSGIYLAAQQTTVHGKTCYGCHTAGLGGNYMTNPNVEGEKAQGFTDMKSIYRISVLVKAVPVVGPDGKQYNELQQSCRWHDKPDNGGTHEKYSLAPTYQGYVDDWFATVMQKCFQITTTSTCQ